MRFLAKYNTHTHLQARFVGSAVVPTVDPAPFRTMALWTRTRGPVLGRAARPFKSRIVKKNEASSGDRLESWCWGDQRPILETGDSVGARSESGAFIASDHHTHSSRTFQGRRGQNGANRMERPEQEGPLGAPQCTARARRADRRGRRTQRDRRTDSPCKLERLRATDFSAKVFEGRSGVGGRRRIPPYHHKMGRAPAHGLTRSSQDPHKSTDYLEPPLFKSCALGL